MSDSGEKISAAAAGEEEPATKLAIEGEASPRIARSSLEKSMSVGRGSLVV